MVFISVNYIFDCTKIVTFVLYLVYSDGSICNYINIQHKTIDDKWRFVRDVYKQWYLKGVNAEIDSIEKLYEFLKAETEGYQIVTVGSSAGGYAAVLFGYLLNATKVLA